MATEQYSYLGPAGTFTEAALQQVEAARGKVWKPVANAIQAISDVHDGDSFAAMIPIENSVEGGVTATQDALARSEGVRIIGEYLVPITFNLYAKPGISLDDIEVVTTHPVSYAQCQKWLNAFLPKHQFIPASSNAQAAADLFLQDNVQAAVAGDTVTEHFEVNELASGIGDLSNAVTRFVLIAGADHPIPERTGADRTSLIVELPNDRAGSLLEMLEQFSVRGISLSLIQSRPIGDELGRYRFNIDAEGHITDARVAEAMMGLHRFSPHVQFLGSYPRAYGDGSRVRSTQTNDSFKSAARWLADLQR